MQQKIDQHIFTGMRRDLDISKHKPEFLYDAYNIRIKPREGDTLLGITNERGPLYKTSYSGKYVGHVVIDNEYIILFLTDANVLKSTQDGNTVYTSTNNNPNSNQTKLSNKDVIIKIKISDYSYSYLFIGNLNLDTEYPIQGIYRYESSKIKKVYWIDGKNQPRVINIEKVEDSIEDTDNPSTRFDFIQTRTLQEEITVNKRIGGIFAPGVIQYAFVYFYLNGQQTNIFYTTPLYYIGNKNTKTVSPEGRANDAFEINLKNVETKFDYLRIYSIHRTSWNATPECRLVTDIKITGSEITYIDYGNVGSTITPLELLYIGGQVIIPDTMAFKDATLFLANYKMDLNILRDLEVQKTFQFKPISIIEDSDIATNDASIVPKFKNGEHYLFGVQIQDKYGRWSDPLKLDELTIESSGVLNNVTCEISGLPSTAVRARGICIYPTTEQRNILATGIVNPTLYQNNILDDEHKLFQSSWFLRPAYNYYATVGSKGYQYEHNTSIFTLGDPNGETDANVMDHLSGDSPHGFNQVEIEGGGVDDINTNFIVSYDIIDFYSPDSEFDYLSDSANSDFKLSYIGDVLLNVRNPIDTVHIHQLRLNSPSTLNDSVGKIIRRNYMDNHYFSSADEVNSQIQTKHFIVYPWNSAGSFTDKRDTETSLTNEEGLKVLFNTLKSNKLLRWATTKTLFADSSVDLTNCTYKSYLEENGNNSLEFNGNYYIGQVDTVLQTLQIPKWYTLNLNNINWQSAFTEKRIVEMKYKTCSHLVLSLDKSLYFNTLKSASTDNRTTVPVLGCYIGSTAIKSAEALASNIRDYMNSIYGTFDTTGTSNPDQWYTSDDVTQSLWDTTVYILGKLQSTGEMYLYKLGYATKTLNNNTVSLLSFIVQLIGGTDGNNKYVWSDDINVVFGFYSSDGTYHGYDNWKTKTEYTDCAGGYILEDGKLKKYYTNTNTVTNSNEIGIKIPNPVSRVYKDNPATGHKTDCTTRLILADLVNKTPVPLQDDVPWIPASIVPSEVTNGSTTINFDIGDTWLQDYYCIKTYPFTREDDNSITDVIQFQCLTRTNLTGRYSTMVSPPAIPEINREEFSKINKVYSNQNNFFNYSKIKEVETVLEETANSMTWTMENIPNSDTDSNVAINLANNYIFSEKVTALATNNLNFYAFHPSSISKISFNPRVEVSPSDGVPIELSTSKRLYGSDTLVNDIGTTNKKAIITTDNGIFFIDDNRRELYLLGADGKISNLSDTRSFNSWFNAQTQLSSSKLFYDRINSDLYLVGNDYCLIFNVAMQEFTSFMSYEGVPTMFNVGYNFYAFDWYYNRLNLDDNYTSLYHMFNGNYNEFFGIYKPVYFSFISNSESQLDKTFTTVESRMDVYVNEVLQTDRHFDYIRSWNEYQDTEEVPIRTTPYNSLYKDSTGKKKFRIWRVNIPRDSGSINRIRNTWTNIKFGFNPPTQKYRPVVNLNNTTNPNIALYYNNLAGSGISDINIEEQIIAGNDSNNLNSNNTTAYETLRMLLHDVNVKYFT